MKTIHIEPHEVDYAQFRLRKACLSDVSGPLIDEDTTILRNGKPVLIYLKDAAKNWNAPETLEKLKIGKNARSSGLEVQAITFGFLPRIGMRNDCCSSTKFARNDPLNHARVCTWAAHAETLIFEHVPEVAGAQQKMIAEKVLPEWRLGNLFTSGIINKNYNIVYHLDKANFNEAWSAMAVFKKNTRGGQLVLPQFNVAVECSNNSLVIFNGTEHLHGVTPVEAREPLEDWHRYSVVFYPMKAMCNCLTRKDELKRVQLSRTQKENKKLQERRALMQKANNKDETLVPGKT